MGENRRESTREKDLLKELSRDANEGANRSGEGGGGGRREPTICDSGSELRLYSKEGVRKKKKGGDF